mgnify:CR=1 FL=1
MFNFWYWFCMVGSLLSCFAIWSLGSVVAMISFLFFTGAAYVEFGKKNSDDNDNDENKKD